MSGMNIEVIARVYYTVHLTDEDVELVKDWIKSKDKLDLPSSDMRDNICAAVQELYEEGEIDLYGDGKETESDFETEEINWSDFEDKEPEDILGIE